MIYSSIEEAWGESHKIDYNIEYFENINDNSKSIDSNKNTIVNINSLLNFLDSVHGIH